MCSFPPVLSSTLLSHICLLLRLDRVLDILLHVFNHFRNAFLFGVFMRQDSSDLDDTDTSEEEVDSGEAI